ncbi:MAG: hypothetical protein AB7T03_06250 [Bacilli bacterium]
MDVVWAFIIGILGQLAVIASCYRLDKYIPKDKYFGRGNLWEKAKPLFVFTKKAKRQDFMTLTIIFQTMAYSMMVFSSVVFLVAILRNNPDWEFISSVVSYVLIALATIENILEIVVLEIMEIRGEHID